MLLAWVGFGYTLSDVSETNTDDTGAVSTQEAPNTPFPLLFPAITPSPDVTTRHLPLPLRTSEVPPLEDAFTFEPTIGDIL